MNALYDRSKFKSNKKVEELEKENQRLREENEKLKKQITFRNKGRRIKYA